MKARGEKIKEEESREQKMSSHINICVVDIYIQSGLRDDPTKRPKRVWHEFFNHNVWRRVVMVGYLLVFLI